MPYVTAADGTRLFYRDWRPREGGGQRLQPGHTFVFSHGWGLGGDCWEYQAAALWHAGHRCITFDRRGCGASDDPGEGHDFDTYADDLACVLERVREHGARHVTLVGHSMGCGEVLRLLARHPSPNASRTGRDRVAGAVLIAPATPLLRARADNPEGLPDAFFDAMVAALLDDRAALMRALAPQFFGAELPGVRVSQAMLDWGVAMALRASAQATIAMVHAYSCEDFRGDLARIDVPCLVIHGDQDMEPTTLERCGRPTAAGIRGARLLVYEGAPHGLFVSHRERLNADLLAFAAERRREVGGG